MNMWKGTTTRILNKLWAITPQPAILALACGPTISQLKFEEETHLAYDDAVVEEKLLVNKEHKQATTAYCELKEIFQLVN